MVDHALFARRSIGKESNATIYMDGEENESKEGLWVMVAMRARKDIHIPEVKLFIPV
uniref:Uncharacterized protein n=1 Tax=Magallana gigas TaxID=29159 RepID=K1S1G4_MAGGI